MEDLEEVFAALRLFRHRGWDIVVLHVVHPDEERLPEGVAYRFEGMEERGAGELFAGRDSRRLPGAVRGPPGDGSAVGAGRRLRLSPRFDGHPVFADVGRIFWSRERDSRALASLAKLLRYRITHDIPAPLGDCGRRGGGGGAGADPLADAAAARADAAFHAALRPRGRPPAAKLAPAARPACCWRCGRWPCC